jgi:hypothetical protein
MGAEGDMKKALSIAAMIVLWTAAFALADLKNRMDLKVGSEAYVCACGTKCPCETLSLKAGKCSCGRDMVSAKVTKIEDGKATFSVDGEERTFRTVGEYACACGEGCDCTTISQKPGKCACGKEMEKTRKN